jgi:hypothetical protein
MLQNILLVSKRYCVSEGEVVRIRDMATNQGRQFEEFRYNENCWHDKKFLAQIFWASADGERTVLLDEEVAGDWPDEWRMDWAMSSIKRLGVVREAGDRIYEAEKARLTA